MGNKASMGAAALALAAVVLAGCERDDRGRTGAADAAVTSSGAGRSPAPVAAGGGRIFSDPEMIARGARIYRENCARCHGERAEGAPNWRQRGPDGRFPAPPLNGTGHTWHHPLAALRHTIRNGTRAMGGSMPGWKDRLSDEDIDAVIAWFQSLWPDVVYREWENIEARARRRAAAN